MKKNILILFIAIGLGAFAQNTPPPTPPTPPAGSRPNPAMNDRSDSVRISMISTKLGLTAEETKKFGPVYTELQKRQQQLTKKKGEWTRKNKGNPDSLPNKQLEAILDSEIVFRQAELNLEKEFHLKFKSAIPIKKVAELYKTEDPFKHKKGQRTERPERGARGEENRSKPKPTGTAPVTPPDTKEIK